MEVLTESSFAELLQKMNLLLWASFAIGAVLVLSVIAQVQSEYDSSAIPVVIGRRQSGDSYTTLQQDVTNCPTDNVTYLVKERLCVNDHYLFNGNLNA